MPAVQSGVYSRARRLPGAAVMLGAALAGCGGPAFEHIGPVQPAAPATAQIAIDRIELTWSNVYLVRRPGAAVLIDAGSPSDCDALAAALAERGVLPSQIRAVVVTHAHA